MKEKVNKIRTLEYLGNISAPNTHQCVAASRYARKFYPHKAKDSMGRGSSIKMDISNTILCHKSNMTTP
jgi:hypothetical protein